jgi:methionyl-tRNA formyltransferase
MDLYPANSCRGKLFNGIAPAEKRKEEDNMEACSGEDLAGPKTRVIIITQDEPFYVPIFLDTFLTHLDKNRYHIDMVCMLPVFNETPSTLIKRSYAFYGFRDCIERGLAYAVTKGLNRFHLSDTSVQRIAERHGIEVRKVDDVNSLPFLETLHCKRPDVIISVSSTQIFRDAILRIPRYGCINVHSAKLPKYRGMMPNFWAMYHGDEKAGITVHTMDKEIDKGKIIVQGEVSILPDDSLDSLIKKSKRRGAELVLEALEKIRNGEAELKDYVGEGSYFSFPTREDVREFRRRGYKLL